MEWAVKVVKYTFEIHVSYSQFHKTLPKSNLQMHGISIRFYEMGDTFRTEERTLQRGAEGGSVVIISSHFNSV